MPVGAKRLFAFPLVWILVTKLARLRSADSRLARAEGRLESVLLSLTN